MTIKTLFAGMAALALLLLNGCNVRAKPVMEEVGVLELPYTVQSLAWHPEGRLLAVGYFMRDVVEVWDVHTKKPVFSVPSKRWAGNRSGQDVLFSPDGKRLIVQDYQDIKHGELKVPESIDEAAEIAARNDKDRYVLARIWDVAQRQEVAQIRGPGTRRIGVTPRAMCVLANGRALVVLRKTSVAMYGLPSGTLESELDLAHPFHDQPQVGRSYETMSCNPARDEISLGALQFFLDAEQFGLTNWTGATAIVIADLERRAIKKVLFSPTPLNGVAYSADGGKLVSFGMSPIRVWDANKDFAALGEIENPPQLDWVRTQRTPVDVLHPPADAPRGNSGDLIAVPDSDVMLGLASDFHFWDTAQRRVVATVRSPRDVSRLAVHKPSATLAAAAINRVHFYRIDAAALQHATKGE
ncbi:WD40 repeat domain-containing protein [Variovorax paradoxus]|uniref:WD40 repeat domain-containing protein n=1 Tax=Variovorax paradoxus TaxID=34073 RepID=UPI002786D1F0|nr:WD40 repeat domain-containing protein [Variovorax paradoxus]MDP9931550.1 WD40 repeat protein [Variovorax paradoxus]